MIHNIDWPALLAAIGGWVMTASMIIGYVLIIWGVIQLTRACIKSRNATIGWAGWTIPIIALALGVSLAGGYAQTMISAIMSQDITDTLGTLHQVNAFIVTTISQITLILGYAIIGYAIWTLIRMGRRAWRSRDDENPTPIEWRDIFVTAIILTIGIILASGILWSLYTVNAAG